MLALALPEVAGPIGTFGDLGAITLLALVQGLTEFLPVSSSGHLVLAQAAMGYEEPALALDVALHVGTLAAVLIVYRGAIAGLLRDAARGELRDVLLLLLGSVPAGLVGVLYKDAIESAFHSPRLAACGLIVTAALLLVGERARRRGGDVVRLTAWHALAIGTAQALAIVPGVSRSGSTIAIGLVCGLAPERAARFSFLLSAPAIAGAAVLSLPDAVEQGIGGGWGPILVGVLVAAVVGWLALRALLAFLGRGAFGFFAAYCLGLSVGALMFA